MKIHGKYTGNIWEYSRNICRNIYEYSWILQHILQYIAGETNKTASKVTKDPYTISDINATIAHLLGIKTDEEKISPSGRPFKVANKGNIIKDIIA